IAVLSASTTPRPSRRRMTILGSRSAAISSTRPSVEPSSTSTTCEEMAAVGGHHGRVDRLLQAAVAEPGGELPELLHGEPGTLAALFVPEAAVPEDGVVAPRHDLLDHEPRSRRGAGGKRCQELVGTVDNQHLAVSDLRATNIRRVRLQNDRVRETRRERREL